MFSFKVVNSQVSNFYLTFFYDPMGFYEGHSHLLLEECSGEKQRKKERSGGGEGEGAGWRKA